MMPETTRLEVEPPDWENREETVLEKPSRRLARLLEKQRPYFERLESEFAELARRRQVSPG